MTETAHAINNIRRAAQVYSQALALVRPLFEGRPDVPRYVLKRIGIRLLESASQEGDALVGVSLTRAHHSGVAEHSLKVAIVIAGMVNYLSLPRQDRLDAVLAGLLHHLGQDLTGAFSRSPGAQAQRSLMSLLLVPTSDKGHYRQVLTAFQHQLGHDGSGEPKMDFPVRQHPLSNVLTVANDFVELTTQRGRAEKAMLPGAALLEMRRRAGSRYVGALLDVLERVVGPCPVGQFLRLSDQRTVLVVGFHADDRGWRAVAVDVADASSTIELDDKQTGRIEGVVDALPALERLAA